MFCICSRNIWNEQQIQLLFHFGQTTGFICISCNLQSIRQLLWNGGFLKCVETQWWTMKSSCPGTANPASLLLPIKLVHRAGAQGGRQLSSEPLLRPPGWKCHCTWCCMPTTDYLLMKCSRWSLRTSMLTPTKAGAVPVFPVEFFSNHG